MDITSWLTRSVELAPLTNTYIEHLANHVRRSLPRDIGRPRRGEEYRLADAISELVTQVQQKRQEAYDLLDPVVRSDSLTNKWVLQTLMSYMPQSMLLYPQRLTEWRQANVLLYNEKGQPDPNSVCNLILARMLNKNRTGWLPHPKTIESYWCWRLNAPHLDPLPYELPIQFDPREPTIIQRSPVVEEYIYVLYSSWRGAAWDDPGAWLVTDEGALRWVGQPTEEQLTAWLTPQEIVSLAPAASQADRAVRALQIMADRMIHRSSSDTPT